MSRLDKPPRKYKVAYRDYMNAYLAYVSLRSFLHGKAPHLVEEFDELHEQDYSAEE